MPTPKRKKGRAPTRQRASHWKSTPPTFSECPQCHQPKLPHRVCANCGYYAGKQILEVE